MAHCFQCGKVLGEDERHIRRKVVTGGSLNLRFPGKSVSQNRTTYGRRIVCRRCAFAIDLASGRDTTFGNWQIAIALALLILVLILKALGVL